MKYYEVRFQINPAREEAVDVLSAQLADIGFEAFVPTADGLNAYIQQSLFDEATMQPLVRDFILPDCDISYSIAAAADENWNQTWEEEGFEPIVLDRLVCVHDTRHSDVPQCQYDIIINPRMAFGTGTHPTTQLILRQLTQMDLCECRVVDAGCGTGVLGILAAKRGAAEVFAYDIDEWSVDNTRINAELNQVTGLTVCEGNADVLPQTGNYDLLIANINRNILLADMPRFAAALKPKGILLMSGFYNDDAQQLIEKGRVLNLHFAHQAEAEGWCMLMLQKTMVSVHAEGQTAAQ